MSAGLPPSPLAQNIPWFAAARPILVNLRLDAFERTGMYNGKDNGSIAYYNWFLYEFWRFVFVQKEVGKVGESFIEFPPMQPGASFNLSELKQKLMEMMNHQGQ